MSDSTCAVHECGRHVYGRGYCRPHHYRWREHGDPLWTPSCSVKGCARKFLAKGFCKLHYRRWTSTGTPASPPLGRDRTALDRFDSMVEKPLDGCWRWTGHLDERGYGRFQFDGRVARAHRFAYRVHVGPISDGLDLDHFRFPQDGCIGPTCVNPQHLRPATGWENTLRGTGPSSENKAKERCKRGHPFTPENTYQRPEGRRCRTCRRVQRRARRLRLRE